MSEYTTIADLDGCPTDDCPLKEWCDHMKSLPGDAHHSDPPCSEYKSDYLIADAVEELASKENARQEYLNEQWKEQQEREEKRLATNKKARDTRWKNREKNALKAQERKKERIADRLGITVRHLELLWELVGLKRLVALAGIPGTNINIQEALQKMEAVYAEITVEAKKSRYAQAAAIAGDMMRQAGVRP